MSMRILIAAAACFVALGSFPFDASAATLCCVCAPKNKLEDKACITGEGTSCADMVQYTKNPALKDVQCDTIILKSGECKPKSEKGGLCPIGPITVETYTVAASGDAGKIPLDTPIVPKLNVNIPGLSFATELQQTGGIIRIPFFAQYISAMYRYLTGVSVVAAAIMIVYGGFRYIFGATIGSTQKGKTIMVDAVIGLLLVVGAYAILNTLNPELLNLKALDVTVIRPNIHIVPESAYQRAQSLAQKSGYTPDPDIEKALKSSTAGKKPATRMFPDNPFDQRTSIPREDLFKMLDVIAQKAGVDPCIPKAILATESGFRNNSIGHDEDVSISIQIQARLDFLRSGRKYSKKPFDSGGMPGSCSQANLAECNQALKASSGVKNDDEFKPGPPDFGLDWRFSHGVGSAQCTIFPPGGTAPSCKGPNGENGRPLGKTCFTVPILMTWEGQLDCMAKLLKAISGTAKTPCGIFNAYGGTKDPDCTGVFMSKKMNAYNGCKAG